jgi:hypothetical protein
MKPAEPHVAGPAGRGGTGNLSQEPYIAPPPAPQQPQQLSGVTRRIVERLDRRRSRTTGASKPKTKRKTKLTPEEQRLAAFNDPRQLQFSFDHPSTKDKSHGKA